MIPIEITFIQQFTQIGNAVPVRLALALGKELGKAIFAISDETVVFREREQSLSPEL